MDLDSGSLIASLIVSSIGFVVFGYGKRQERLPQVVIGLVMMGFPYLVPNVAAMAGIAGGLLILLWIAVRFGI
jgi:hypothetical protein